MAERNRSHIVVPTPPSRESFTLAGPGGGTEKAAFSGKRSTHGKRLTEEFEKAWLPDDEETKSAGTCITFVSFPDLELAIERLESQRPGAQPELVAVQQEITPEGEVTRATVFIPDGKKEFFLKKLEQYVATADVTEGKPANAALIEGIASIRRATIRELWTDPAHE